MITPMRTAAARAFGQQESAMFPGTPYAQCLDTGIANDIFNAQQLCRNISNVAQRLRADAQKLRDLANKRASTPGAACDVPQAVSDTINDEQGKGPAAPPPYKPDVSCGPLRPAALVNFRQPVTRRSMPPSTAR